MSIYYRTRPAMWPLSHGEWALADDLVQLDTRTGCQSIVPGGTRFNGASIPRLLWFIMGHPFTPEYAYPSAVHDYWYSTRQRDRARTDEEFYRGVRSELLQSTHSAMHGTRWQRAKRAAHIQRLKTTAWLMWKACAWFGPRYEVAA